MSTSTSHDAMVLQRTGSVKIFKRFLFKFLNVLLKNPFKVLSRVMSVNEFRSLIEIAGALHSKEKGTKRTTEDKHIMSGVLDRKECEKAVVDLLSASTMGNVVPQGIIDVASRAAYTVDGELPVPEGERWAVAARGVDFSGKWQLRADDKFKEDYDRYLATLGQPLLVRTVAVGLLGRTKEEIMMSESGKSLLIRGENARGIWERKLISSGTEVGKPEFEPKHFPIMTADSEKVGAESWWEEKGTVHVSVLHGVSRYHGGGVFESRRYLEDGGETYVCVSTFHFKDVSRKPSRIEWRFGRIET